MYIELLWAVKCYFKKIQMEMGLRIYHNSNIQLASILCSPVCAS